MRIKDEIFCFAHLRWCHNGWASNILIVVDTGYAGIHHSKYWMPIHYDTIEDGQNKKSHLLFSKWKLWSFGKKPCGIDSITHSSDDQITSLLIQFVTHTTAINTYSLYRIKHFLYKGQLSIVFNKFSYFTKSI